MKYTLFIVAVVLIILTAVQILSTTSDASLPSACDGDDRYPEIDYSHRLVRNACNVGGVVSGYWAIDFASNPYDGNVTTTATNFSTLKGEPEYSGGSITLACRADETLALIFLPESMSTASDIEISMGYRLDAREHKYMKWLTFEDRTLVVSGSKARDFMLELYDATSIQMRVFSPTFVDSNSNLVGIRDAVDTVARACGWERVQSSG